MSSRGSTALRELESWLRCIDDRDAPLTVAMLLDVVRQAAEGTESWEHDDYMGMDQ